MHQFNNKVEGEVGSCVLHDSRGLVPTLSVPRQNLFITFT